MRTLVNVIEGLFNTLDQDLTKTSLEGIFRNHLIGFGNPSDTHPFRRGPFQMDVKGKTFVVTIPDQEYIKFGKDELEDELKSYEVDCNKEIMLVDSITPKNAFKRYIAENRITCIGDEFVGLDLKARGISFMGNGWGGSGNCRIEKIKVDCEELSVPTRGYGGLSHFKGHADRVYMDMESGNLEKTLEDLIDLTGEFEEYGLSGFLRMIRRPKSKNVIINPPYRVKGNLSKLLEMKLDGVNTVKLPNILCFKDINKLSKLDARDIKTHQRAYRNIVTSIYYQDAKNVIEALGKTDDGFYIWILQN